MIMNINTEYEDYFDYVTNRTISNEEHGTRFGVHSG